MKWRDSGFSGRSTESAALCAWVHGMQYPCAGQGRQPCPVNWRCTDSYWVITWRKMPQVSGFAAPPPAEKLEETEEQSLKLTKHNGRAGKNDAYTPKLKKRPARRRACSKLERWRNTHPGKLSFWWLRNFLPSWKDASVLMSTFWTEHCILMKERLTFNISIRTIKITAAPSFSHLFPSHFFHKPMVKYRS